MGVVLQAPQNEHKNASEAIHAHPKADTPQKIVLLLKKITIFVYDAKQTTDLLDNIAFVDGYRRTHISAYKKRLPYVGASQDNS